MRIDKYLKVARVLKKRTTSKELADNDRIYINDRIAKPSTLVNVGDIIKIVFGNRELVIRVLDTAKQASKADASLLYEIIEETKILN